MNDKFIVSDIINQFLCGDSLKILKRFPNDCIDLSLFSPSYFKQRDYKIEGQMGKEKTKEEFLENLTNIIKELYRITKPTGSMVVNIGDTIIKKHWALIPERFAIMCDTVGFGSVSKMIWNKLNAMPSSTSIRWSPKWEPIYVFSKTEDWYFDLDKIRIPTKTKSKSFNYRTRNSTQYKFGDLTNRSNREIKIYNTTTGIKKQDNVYGSDGKKKGNYNGFNARYDHSKIEKKGKNPGDVMNYSNQKNTKDHPAVFPTYIPTQFVRSLCPKNGLVLDPFCGSGTTLLDAYTEGKRYCGIELKKEYMSDCLIKLENVRKYWEKVESLS